MGLVKHFALTLRDRISGLTYHRLCPVVKLDETNVFLLVDNNSKIETIVPFSPRAIISVGSISNI